MEGCPVQSSSRGSCTAAGWSASPSIPDGGKGASLYLGACLPAWHEATVSQRQECRRIRPKDLRFLPSPSSNGIYSLLIYATLSPLLPQYTLATHIHLMPHKMPHAILRDMHYYIIVKYVFMLQSSDLPIFPGMAKGDLLLPRDSKRRWP